MCAFLWDLQPELRADLLELGDILGTAQVIVGSVWACPVRSVGVFPIKPKAPSGIASVRGLILCLRLSLRLVVVTVGALAGFVQRRTALAAEFGYGCALRDLGLRVLRLCCLRPKLLAQVTHVGGRENAVLLFVSVLAAELIVDGDYVFQQQDCHHQQFIHQSDHNGSEDHDQDAVDTQPVAIAEVVLRRGKEHEEAQNDHICREENVQSLQNFLYDQVLEIAGIKEKSAAISRKLRRIFGKFEI